jgi:hypothetical protein
MMKLGEMSRMLDTPLCSGRPEEYQRRREAEGEERRRERVRETNMKLCGRQRQAEFYL